MLVDATTITPRIPVTGLITVPRRTTAEAQWWLPAGIELTIAVQDIGTAAPITSGSPDTGAGGMANTFGSAVIMSYADIDRVVQGAAAFHPAWEIGGSAFLECSNDRRSQAPARQTKTHGRREAA